MTSTTYQNPILPGFYPDPSICRVEEDYYLITSTFAYFPAVPIFHSTDLVHWKQIGNIIDRPEQIRLVDATHSGGIFAPTLRYHKGTFYMITTNVSFKGNFVVTATNPAGPWSDPYFLQADGIDPSLFFDEDDRCYYCGTQARREGAAYYGDNEIFIQELNLDTMRLVGESYPAWHGALRDVEWPEGPHIYKKDDWYYLLISEAGTAHSHAVSIARSKSLTEPFTGYTCNPILTHRHLGVDFPIVNVGHPDIVETQNGEWWMVALASRPYGGYFRNLGRETYLVPFVWENGWPLINPGIGMIEATFTAPNLPCTMVESLPQKEDFNGPTLPLHYVYLRNPKLENYSLTTRIGYLSMKLAPERITEICSPSFVCTRQTDMNFEAETKLEFWAMAENEVAGLVLLQSNEYNYQFILTQKNNNPTLCVIQCAKGIETLIAETAITLGNLSPLQLRVTQKIQNLLFDFSTDGGTTYSTIADNIDARILSTDVAGGFVGTCIGIYGSSNGKETTNQVSFDWLSYKGI